MSLVQDEIIVFHFWRCPVRETAARSCQSGVSQQQQDRLRLPQTIEETQIFKTRKAKQRKRI